MGGESDAPPMSAAVPSTVALAMHFESEYPAYLRGGVPEAIAVCHVAAPEEAVASAARDTSSVVRPPLDLVTVIDVSGSMNGEKLELVKTTLEFIIRNLRAEDRLGVVSFDTHVTTVLTLTEMGESGKARALAACKALRSGSCTNLSGGLFAGMSLLRETRRGGVNTVRTVMLLTDGMANEGICKEELLLPATRELLGAESDYSIYTFGYGSDHQATLLKSLAEIGRGMYYFIDTNEAVPPSFGDCLGGLLTTVAQNMTLTLTATDGRCHITKVETTRPVVLAPGGTSATITLGDIQAEEVRDLLVRLALAPLPEETLEDAAYPHLEATLTYVNVLSTSFESQTAALVLRRPSTVPAGQPASELVREQVSRLRTAATIKEAMEDATRGDMGSARQRLQALDADFSADTSPLVQAMRADVSECLAAVANREAYAAHGMYCMSSAMQMHSAQRSNRVFAEEEEEAGRKSYVTKSKAAWRGFSKAFADQ